MRPKKRIIFLILILTIYYPFIQESEAAASKDQDNQAVRILVELRQPNNDINAAVESIHPQVKKISRVSAKMPRTYAAGGRQRRSADLRRWRTVEVPAQSVSAVLHALQTDPGVARASLENTYQAVALPDDPRFGEQYHLYSPNQPTADINARPAWEITTGSASNTIAVIDGGVDFTHVDLQGKAWINGDEVSGNLRDDDANGFIDDINGWDFVDSIKAQTAHPHATHVAGLAAASSNNGQGIAGVDWQARVMSVRVLNRFGVGREADIAAGISYAASNGAKIINLSIAGSASSLIKEAIENAYASGVVVVAAAGNSGRDTGLYPIAPVCSEPADVDMVLGVGATDEKGQPASFSNYGRCVNISAPGRKLLSTVTNNRYQTMTGTSMSAPLAAGVASLYLAVHPGASPAEVIAALGNGQAFTGVNANKWNNNYQGKLDAAKVLGVVVDENANEPAPPTPSPAPLEPPNLSIVTSAPATTQLGGILSYSIKVANNGSSTASGIVVENKFDRDTMPVYLPTNCQIDRSAVKCNQGSLPAGSEINLQLNFTVDTSARCSSTLHNYSYVYAQERGSLRRQARSERADTKINCP